MENRQPSPQEIEQMALLMAEALRDLQCPEQCGQIHQFIEVGAQVYQEEMEWAYFVVALRNCRKPKQQT